MRELESLIREIDDEIERAFEETFEATATNFEEMVEHLFPGGRGRLRRVSLRAVQEEQAPAAEGEEGAEAEEPDPDEEEREERDEFGVEIEVNPAGKSTRKLSLMSGGEKSLVALAFVFAVFLARPCPFYILDEVEAALDDANIDRFLQLVRRFSDRAQFVIVTHQKRTMDAADVLYGVTMGGDGVTKVVSRKLPRDRTEDDADDGERRRRDPHRRGVAAVPTPSSLKLGLGRAAAVRVSAPSPRYKPLRRGSGPPLLAAQSARGNLEARREKWPSAIWTGCRRSTRRSSPTRRERAHGDRGRAGLRRLGAHARTSSSRRSARACTCCRACASGC